MAWLKQQQAPEDEINATRSNALTAAKRAIGLGPEWKETLRELLQHDYPQKEAEENDLEIFENDPEFRQLVGLS